MPSQASVIFSIACRLLWRDVWLPLLERSHDLRDALERDLIASGEDEQALTDWLVNLFDAEQAPVSLGGVREALYHAFDSFRFMLSAEDRHAWQTRILQDPVAARSKVETLLLDFPDVPIVTSYYWRSDPWRIAWVLHEGTWWQCRFDPAAIQARGPEGMVVRPFTEVLASFTAVHQDAAVRAEQLHAERLAVRFYSGEHIVYPWFTQRSAAIADAGLSDDERKRIDGP